MVVSLRVRSAIVSHSQVQMWGNFLYFLCIFSALNDHKNGSHFWLPIWKSLRFLKTCFRRFEISKRGQIFCTWIVDFLFLIQFFRVVRPQFLQIVTIISFQNVWNAETRKQETLIPFSIFYFQQFYIMLWNFLSWLSLLSFRENFFLQ